MRERLSTRRLVLASAAHPWRTIGAWAAAAVVAIVAIGALLGGSLSTENHPTDNRQSQRAAQLIDRSFPAGSRASDAEVIVLRSEHQTVDSPQFRAKSSGSPERFGTSAGVASDDVGKPLVSRDRHATLVSVHLADSDAIEDVIAAVDGADAKPAFTAAVTGDQTRQHDFDQLSQDDLKSGELQFGLPAALIVLLLVFGAVVAGLIPLLMAMLSIVIGLGIVAMLAQAFSLSVFVVNMLTGMGLALGIDYALFVISRYREERGAAARSSTPSAPRGRRRTAPSCSAGRPSWSRCSAC